MKYIKQIDNRKLYGDGIGGVDLFDFSHANDKEESRVEAVATVASICYGKPPKDAGKLVERLWTESGGLPSSAFEFIRWGSTDWSSSINASLRNDRELKTFEEIAQHELDRKDAHISRQIARHNKRIATFRVKVPIFIARQVMRHRSFSYQELSRRYTTDKQVPLEFWLPQMMPNWAATLNDTYRKSMNTYSLMLLDLPPEQARCVLPQGAYTEFWMMGNTAAWRNYFKLRLDLHTQKEHRELAQAMADLLKEHQPVLWAAVDPQGAE